MFRWDKWLKEERRNLALTFAIDAASGKKINADTLVENAKTFEKYLEGDVNA